MPGFASHRATTVRSSPARAARTRTTGVGDRIAAHVTIDGRSPADLLRTVCGLYAVGLDVVTLRSDSSIGSDSRRAIAAAASESIGPEVVAETNSRPTLRNPLGPTDASVRRTAIHLRLVALSMHRDAAQALREGGTELPDPGFGSDH